VNNDKTSFLLKDDTNLQFPDLELARRAQKGGAFQGLDSFEGRSSVKTWLIRILVKQAAKYHRYRRIRKTESINNFFPQDSGSDSSARDFEIRMDIKTMIKTLSPEHREVIVLRELEGFSYEEMAEILDIPRGTVDSRLFRARQELKERFKDELSQ